MPSYCSCGSKYDVDHAISCKKGGFVVIRHNRLRDPTASMLKEVCYDVQTEPTLNPVTGEEFHERTAVTSNEARLDIRARGFWQSGQRAFFDVRVFDSNAQRYRNMSLPQCYTVNEEEKKRKYNERVLQTEHGSFTLLVFSTTGGMGEEAKRFYTALAYEIATKRKQLYPIAISWIRTKLCFSLIRSVILCIRGSRTASKDVHQSDDVFTDEKTRTGDNTRSVTYYVYI
ncbi:Uncharacterised protein r2_g4332 [Pycnogonum litorale]